jgi:hypothetical protein
VTEAIKHIVPQLLPLKSIQITSPMIPITRIAQTDKVTLDELMVSTLAMTDALAKLIRRQRKAYNPFALSYIWSAGGLKSLANQQQSCGILVAKSI